MNIRYFDNDAYELDGATRDEVNAATLTESEALNAYADMLNEQTITVCGIEYGEGDAFRRLDPVTFRSNALTYYSEIDLDDYPETRDAD